MNKKIFWISAIIIGIIIGLFLNQNLINEMLLPEFTIEDSELNTDAKLYKFYITIEKDISEKDIERLGKHTVTQIKKQGADIETVALWIFKNKELYATINFEVDEKFLIDEKDGEYKGLYYSINIE